MILDITLLVTSVQLGNATEVFGVPAGGSIAVTPVSIAAPATVGVEQAAWSALLERSGAAGLGNVGVGAAGVGTASVNGGPRPVASVERVSLDQLSRLSGADLFTQLGLLNSRDLRRALSSDPKIVDSLLAHPPSASETAATWRMMSASSKKALATAAPRVVGNLEGLPYAVRNTYNRAYLAEQMTTIRAELEQGTGRAASGDLKSQLHMLQQVQLALKSTDGIPRELIALDTSGEGTAVISIGDLASADYVSYLIPGMFYGVDSRIVPWTGIAADLAAEQSRWLTRLGHTDEHAAVLSWIGYRTPTLVDVASMTDAREGSVALSGSLRGLTATRTAHEPYVSVLAHSYGATAALLALQTDHVDSGVHVDALAMVGSPGSPAQSVDDLQVTGSVWVGAARWDPISQSGVFGSQPTSAAYGALSMGVDGGTDPLTSKRLTGTVSHNDYFTPGSETLRNFALIGIDAGDYVLQPGGRMLAAG